MFRAQKSTCLLSGPLRKLNICIYLGVVAPSSLNLKDFAFNIILYEHVLIGTVDMLIKVLSELIGVMGCKEKNHEEVVNLKKRKL